MHFQNLPLLPFLAPLLAVPLIIHLLNQKFPKLVLFPSVELIRRSMAQRSKLIRWRHWLLTLVRTLVALLALLAFLQPFIARQGQPPPTPQMKRHVVLILDHSFSLELPDGLMSLRSRAGAEALRILDSLGAEDEMQVIAAGRASAACFTGWSRNVSAARSFITAMGPGYERADLSKAADTAAALMRDVIGGVEVYFISDFQRTNWSDASFASLPSSARVFFVSVGDPAKLRTNRAVTHAEIVSGTVLAGGEVTLSVQIANHSDATLDEAVEAVIDNRLTYEAQVKAAPWSVQRVPLQIRAPSPGWHTLDVRLKNGDSMPLDDVFHLPLHVTEKEEVVIATDDPNSSLTLRFLEAAINPYAGNAGSLLPRRVEASKLTPADLAATSKIVLTRLNHLPQPQIRALADYMKAGGGALWFLDGKHDAENAVAMAEWFAQPDAVPLRPTLRREAGGEGAQVARGKFDSRFLRLFRGSARESLAQLSFYELWQAAPVGQAEILLSYADGTPALAHSSPGLGTLLMCNFSVAEMASNIARQRVFPAWIQEMTAQLSGERVAASRFAPGDVMDAEAWTRDVQGTEFTGPAGTPVISTRTMSGERVQMSLTARAPGFHTLLDGKRRVAALLAANIAPEESDLRVLEGGVATKQAQQDAVSASQISAGADYAELVRGASVFQWFVWASLVMLALETLLQTKIRRTVA